MSATQSPSRIKIAPGPEGLPVLGNFLDFPKISQLDALRQLHRDYGDIVRLAAGPAVVHLANSPSAVQHILRDNNRNYIKGRALSKSEDLLGQGLLTAEGDFWLSQRKLIQPTFHRQHIASFAGAMTASTEDLLAVWAQRPAGEAFNVAQDFLGLTLEIVARSLFSVGISAEEKATVARTMPFILHETSRRINSIFDLREKLPTPSNLRMRRSIARLDRIVYGIIEQRRRSGEELPDLLGMLLAAQDEDSGQRMSDKQLRDEVMTLFLAGHETTALNLSWTVYLLARHPEALAELQAEVDGLLNGRVPNAEDYQRLRYTRMVVDESLRLLPPAWAFGREPLEDDVLDGYRVPAQSSVIVSPYIVHRHPDYWAQPDVFRPQRFDPEQSHERPRFAYLPFGGGPRQCIGNNFALMEAVLVLAMLAQRYSFELAPGYVPEFDTAFTLRPANGLWINLHPR